MSSNNLDGRYEKISSSKKNAGIFRWILIVSLFGVLITVNLVLKNYQHLDNTFWTEAVIFVIFSIALAISFKKQKDFVIDKKREQFFVFYDAYKALEEYKDEKDKKSQKKARNKIKQLLSHVERWTQLEIPQVFRNELLDSMYGNLTKVTKFVEQGKVDDLSLFMKKLHHVSEIMFNGSPSLEEWKDFSSSMTELKILPDNNISQRISVFTKVPGLKYILISPLAGIMIDPVLTYEGMKPADALLGSVIVSFTAMGAIAAIAALIQRSPKELSRS